MSLRTRTVPTLTVRERLEVFESTSTQMGPWALGHLFIW